MYFEYNKLRELVANILDAPGRGGNISIKNNTTMIIKASGEDLKKLNHKVSKIDLCTKKILNDNKPSIEYLMHLNSPFKYVLHYHPFYLMQYLCSDHFYLLEKMFDCELIDVFVPGEELANAVSKSKSNLLFLKNHGVIIRYNTIDEIIKVYNTLKNINNIKNDLNTPDDFVIETDEQLLTSLAITRLIEIFNFKKESPDEKFYQRLLTPDEKFRQNKIRGDQ